MTSDLLVAQIPLLDKVLRTIAVYLFLVLALRLAGKRELAQLNSFDLVVVLLLSNTVQNAIIGPDNSLLGGLLGAAVLLAANYTTVRPAVSALGRRSATGRPDAGCRPAPSRPGQGSAARPGSSSTRPGPPCPASARSPPRE
jgi:hypothetical protein